jgi:molybdate transport system ATP-binding protein
MQFYELSAGQQRAALLARALVKNPVLLILDEPCQGLDGPHRKSFLGMLDHLIRTRKTTVVYVTHNEREIPASIRRVMRL